MFTLYEDLIKSKKDLFEEMVEILKLTISSSSDKEVSEIRSLNRIGLGEKTPYTDLFEGLDNQYCMETPNCADCPIRNFCDSYRESERLKEKEYTLVDLFCGAGGFSQGFKRNGFSTVLANDFQEVCVNTYLLNHPELDPDKAIFGDISEVVSTLPNYNLSNISVLIGGPPCQSFSTANRQRLIDDPRNNLYKHYVESVRIIQPKFFVMENVKGMSAVLDQVLEDFKNIGYVVEAKVLNAKNFSVPQNRERLIFIGTRLEGVSPLTIFEEIENISNSRLNYVLEDALYGLRSLQAYTVKNAAKLGSEESGFNVELQESLHNEYLSFINQGVYSHLVFHHKARYNNDRDIEIFGRMIPGDKSDSPRIADIMPYQSRKDVFKDKYHKLEPNKPCKTITAHMKNDCNMYIHPLDARGLTPREAARIQSYPDSYFFTGPYTKKFMQIGNSVPPLLADAIAQIIKKYL